MAQRSTSVEEGGAEARYRFAPEEHEAALTAVVDALAPLERVDERTLTKILRRHPKSQGRMFRKSDLIRGVRHFAEAYGWDADALAAKLRMKPIRTQSGVAPVTVLTRPFPCPGRCIFCPNDVRMPKSYLSMEPGAQRAAQHRFDPYAQTMARLYAFHANGHRVDKVELIILGGTWSFYPEAYQIWFVKRCFDAMNAFAGAAARHDPRHLDFTPIEEIVGTGDRPDYNGVIRRFLDEHQGGALAEWERADWAELAAAHAANETAAARCVGLVVETRPDHLSKAEVARARRLGVTKVQIGYQSLSDDVLALNKRGHDVAATRRAMRLLRRAGFKIHAHWMPNIHGSSPSADIADFSRIFTDPDFRPDELKVYPTSLIESAELMAYYRRGEWRPYADAELLEVLTACLPRVPRTCRVTRVIRDIPSHDIVAGNKASNLREVAEGALAARGLRQHDIRSREIRGRTVEPETLRWVETRYATSTGEEHFLEVVTPDDRIVAFLRLSLPGGPPLFAELERSAIVREVHVYGAVVRLGGQEEGRAQHLGLGRELVRRAARLAQSSGYERLAVISSVGTRAYYRSLGFVDGELYQHLSLRDRGLDVSPVVGQRAG